jgi:DNA (cytosine-5)-methyltransferase 1
MSLVAIDLFCGCGGVSNGFLQAGVRVAAGVDFDERCKETYEKNNPKSHFLLKDISRLSAKEIVESVGDLRSGENRLLLSACAPCQPFSQQNRGTRVNSEKRILTHVARLVRELEPDFVFLENVYGLKNVRGYSAFRRLLNTLEKLGYKTKSGMVNACDYGVAQVRQRFVLTAVRGDCVCWASPTHGQKCNSPYRTVRDAIERFPAIQHGKSHPEVSNHVASILSPTNYRRAQATPPDGGSRSSWPKELRLKCHVSHDGHPDVYGRLKWDSPAPTLTTKCTSISNGRFGHPEQHRAISAREAASLQGFSDDYVFVGGVSSLRRLVGNAVPPPVAKSFAQAFLQTAKTLNGSNPKAKWKILHAKQAEKLSDVVRK